MKCPSCPVPLGVECIAEKTAHTRFCELSAANHCEYRQAIYRLSTGTPAPFPCDGQIAVTVEPVTQAELVVIPLADNLAVTRCPHRGKPIECGCSVEKRYCGLTLDIVTYADCLRCVTT